MSRNLRSAARGACLTSLLLFFLLLSFCRPAPPPTPYAGVAEPDRAFDRLFERTGGGWTGADGTVSVALPDGRTVWLFGDTFLGTVAADGSRPMDAPFIRNSLVVQKGPLLETRFSLDGDTPVSFFEPDAANHWYWPGHGLIEGLHLKIFVHRFDQVEPRLWSWRWIGTEVAQVSLPELSLMGFSPAPSDNEVLYGVCVLEDDRFTYIYGTADLRTPKEAHLARATAGRIQEKWHYFTGRGWSEAAADSRPMLSGVSTQFGVLQDRGGFYLFSMEGRVAFSSEIVVYRSDAPWGPWSGPLVVYRAPEAGQAVFAYNPFVHAQFTQNRRVLVSYNVNHVSEPEALYKDAGIYRPRFIRVDMEQVARHFRTAEK